MGKSFHCTLLRMILRGSKLFSACLDPVAGVVKEPTRRNSLKDQRPRAEATSILQAFAEQEH